MGSAYVFASMVPRYLVVGEWSTIPNSAAHIILYAGGQETNANLSVCSPARNIVCTAASRWWKARRDGQGRPLIAFLVHCSLVSATSRSCDAARVLCLSNFHRNQTRREGSK